MRERRDLPLDSQYHRRRRLYSMGWAYLSTDVPLDTSNRQDVLKPQTISPSCRHRSTSHLVLIVILVAMRGFSSMIHHLSARCFLSCRSNPSLFRATTFRRRGTFQSTRNSHSRQLYQWTVRSTSHVQPRLWWRCSWGTCSGRSLSGLTPRLPKWTWWYSQVSRTCGSIRSRLDISNFVLAWSEGRRLPWILERCRVDRTPGLLCDKG